MAKAISLQLEIDSEQNNDSSSLQARLQERLLDLYKENYSNTAIIDAKAIHRISSKVEILVVGPARMGKSELIKQLSNDRSIQTSPGLNQCTKTPTEYTDQFGLTWWDTPGIENWNEENINAFFTDKFQKRQILPRAAIFCRTSGALASEPRVQFMFRKLESYGIPLFYVINKWPFLSVREQEELVQEASKLLDGQVTGIYPCTKTTSTESMQRAETVKVSSCDSCCGLMGHRSRVIPSNNPPPIEHLPAYRALECKENLSYIVPVNSCVDQSENQNSLTTHPKQNLNILRRLIVEKTCSGNNDQKLVDLYKNTMSLAMKAGGHFLEILDDLGFNTASLMTNKDEQIIYRLLKEGGKNKHIASPVVEAVINKLTGNIFNEIKNSIKSKDTKTTEE